MKLLIFVWCLIAIQVDASVVGKKCVKFNNSYYNEEILLTDLDRPYLLAVDRKTNNLYFSHSLNPNTSETQSIRLNLHMGAYQKISNISYGFSHAADRLEKTGNVYIGGWTKIYKLSFPEYEPVEIITVPDNWITDMALIRHNVLMYSTSPEGKVYAYRHGTSMELPQFNKSNVTHFTFDDNRMNVAFFSNDTGMYSMTFMGDTVLYKTVVPDQVRAITLDTHGEVYACLIDGLYKFDRENTTVKKLYHIKDAFGLAFDKDNNVIYSTDTTLVRLLVDKENDCQ